MKKETLYYTKWDTRLLTKQQKTQWLYKMFELGFTWKYSANMEADYYFIYPEGISWCWEANNCVYFKEHVHTLLDPLKIMFKNIEDKPSYEELKSLTLEVMSVFDINDYDDTEHLAEDAVTLAEDIYKLLKDKTEG